MISCDLRAMHYHNRKYWARAYTLKDLKNVPEFLKEVLREAYYCGKSLNLLKLCSPKVFN